MPAVIPVEREPLKVAGLFAGIGGIERGLRRAGHDAQLLCENDTAAVAVLKSRFPDVEVHLDVCDLAKVPSHTTLVTAGFPCQDLSQAGEKRGIAGARSGLVGEVFRLVEKQRPEWVLLENVPFMLQLSKGRAMEVIVEAFETLGYKWAYRVVDSRAFGVPQRRRRVYVLACTSHDPREVLFADDAGPPDTPENFRAHACGFYWTEGVRGLGWAVDAVPTLKGGSAVGIPSPPAVWLPSGEMIKLSLTDAERIQGFPANWTKPAEEVARKSARWRLVGNAVTCQSATWIGQRLRKPGQLIETQTVPIDCPSPWPTSAWNVGDGRFMPVGISEFPKNLKRPPLLEFLKHTDELLSEKATAGFLSRTQRAKLRFPDGFIDAIEEHLDRMRS